MFSFAPDRQPSHATADATGDTSTRTPRRAFRAETSYPTPTDPRRGERAADVAVSQADGEP
ncbi:hypothetical protein J421_4810 (plasmid) [Gemmatirosa kalamazoonensis]|jgi:hypothetical protein|uniref:Uncharacterized protein n=1 Tax=Gemmatirosa kalamazoonensis TaxID=861299 RepID=W0RPT1_9BACT|nr:hypothetical protein [Gemmatirosa kalamazoonensis]AHG92345.1 hypothetical protein J421_4810 [Gemmatirosa kalamazoonensis]